MRDLRILNAFMSERYACGAGDIDPETGRVIHDKRDGWHGFTHVLVEDWHGDHPDGSSTRVLKTCGLKHHSVDVGEDCPVASRWTLLVTR